MPFHSWLQNLRVALAPGRGQRHPRRPGSIRAGARRLILEILEDRVVPSTFMVVNLADSGAGSLRQALIDANALPGADVIRFGPHARDGVITLTSGELSITDSLTIDGPGDNRLTISGNDASRVFSVSGSTTYAEIDGLTIAHGLTNKTTALGPLGPVALGGGLLNTGAHVTLSGVTLADNRAVASQTGYVQTNLISDIAGLAQLTDPNLKDPWGTSFSQTGLFSVSDTKTNVSTLYAVTAAGVTAMPPTVAVPTTATGSQGPTGQVHNDTSSFLVNGTPATFIYANLNGTISAWNASAGTTAQVKAAPAGAGYQGLDMASTPSGDFLYAANAKQGRIDVFNSSFALTSLGANAFVDPQLPAGLVPFNVEGINGELYVAYAPAGAPAARSSAPEGAGAVAVFDTSGNFIKQLISGGKLAAPWGITLAPSSFGQFGGALLVGNFSYLDTEINAFDPVTGAYLGTLTDGTGNPLLAGDNGLWDLTFGIGGNGGLPDTLYFATGLNNEVNGLFGAIDPGLSLAEGGAVANLFGGTLEISHSIFTGNEAVATHDVAGGGIANDAGSTLTVAHSAFIGNHAIGADASGGAGDGGRALGGGAVSNRGGSQVTVSHSSFAGNLAQGGRGSNGGPAQNGGNGANGAGGAIANLADSFLVAAAGSKLIVEQTAFTDNQAVGGTGGNGGAGGIGGNGSNGNGGAITNIGEESTALVTYSTFNGNQALGADGGNGGAGKRGGSGGIGQGGAITQFSANLTVEHSQFTDNQATGGAGGTGGASASGGAGGAGAGGAINSGVVNATPNILPTLTVDYLMIDGNRATGGRGGAGGSSGNGGNGGVGAGGGIRSRGILDGAQCLLVFNQATGGAGGDRGAGGLLGGNGGLGAGGGIVNDVGATGTVSQTLLVANQATGGAGGVGGNGGNGQGGGIWNGSPNPLTGAPSTLTVTHSTIVNNRADGGVAGVGGSDGQGVGGGLYVTPGSSASADPWTVILANQASTSDDDVFGTLGSA
jgi:uncharacterized protein (TIGR03118 family)